LVLVGNLATIKSNVEGKYNPWKSFAEYAEGLSPARSAKEFE